MPMSVWIRSAVLALVSSRSVLCDNVLVCQVTNGRRYRRRIYGGSALCCRGSGGQSQRSVGHGVPAAGHRRHISMLRRWFGGVVELAGGRWGRPVLYTLHSAADGGWDTAIPARQQRRSGLAEYSTTMQIVTGIEVNSEAYFLKLREYCPSALNVI